MSVERLLDNVRSMLSTDYLRALLRFSRESPMKLAKSGPVHRIRKDT